MNWANQATATVHLWIVRRMGEIGNYSRWTALARQLPPDELRHELMLAFGSELDAIPGGLFKDLLAQSLASVDWHQIASALHEGERERV